MPSTKSATANWKIHPGEILREEFLKPMKLSANELARSIRVSAPRINDIILERRGITAENHTQLVGSAHSMTAIPGTATLAMSHGRREAHERPWYERSMWRIWKLQTIPEANTRGVTKTVTMGFASHLPKIIAAL